MENKLVNRVANSGIITLNLEDYFPEKAIAELDIKEFLFHELILKEKDFRTSMKELDWTQYQDSHLCVYCSNDAIIPTWAYMLIASHAQEFAASVFTGTKHQFLNHFYMNQIENINVDKYANERIVIKGCSNKPVPPGAYMALTYKLKPHAKKIMFGEPCSTVPIYKKSIVKK